MSNPHYTPEVSTKVVLVNFIVKESGLEEQSLGIVVKSEQPTIEQKKNQEVMNIASNKKILVDLEDKILRLLSESKGNLLEDFTLNETLKVSKKTSEKVKNDLEAAEQTMKRIDETREFYRICGRVASILFFVLNDLNKIDPMYQFSLDWYKELFQTSIEESRSNNYGDRIKNIIKTHQLKVYKQVCRSLFEKHKLLLSLQMCVKLKMSEGEINEDEWTFFLRGGLVMDRSTQPVKPLFDWITTTAWDNITELEKMLPSTFAGIANAVTLNPKEWQRWFLSTRPEPINAQFPGEWETKCEDKLKKMIFVRCLRPDRVIFSIRNFVEHFMKKEFIENKPTNLEEVFNESRPETPIILVLSPGVDPSDQLKKLAEKLG
jgi:dynein heavy chain, axonemal